MAKKIMSALAVAVLLLPPVSVGAFAGGTGTPPDVSAKAAIVIDARSGGVLFAKNGSERLSMASTTKIMTSLIAIETGDLAREIKITDNMAKIEGSSMGLLSGDTVTMEGLVYGMLLESGNDAANAAAISIAGSVEKFADMMNQRAARLGMTGTHFVTPSGLDDREHYSTAADMAKLGAAAIANPVFAGICSQSSVRVSFGNPPYQRWLYNHNRLLNEYDGAFGIKTGFTKKSGRCLVSAAMRGEVTLVAVTLNDPNDWVDHKAMLDYGFSLFKERELSKNKTLSIKITGGISPSVPLKYAEPPRAALTEQDVPRVTAQIYQDHFAYAPVRKGAVMGGVCYYIDGKVIFETQLLAAADVECAPYIDPPQTPPKRGIAGFFKRAGDFFKNLFG